jgi:hypothetical protein
MTAWAAKMAKDKGMGMMKEKDLGGVSPTAVDGASVLSASTVAPHVAPAPRDEDVCVSEENAPDYAPEHFSGGVTDVRMRGGVLIFRFAGGGEIHVSNPVVFMSPERH